MKKKPVGTGHVVIFDRGDDRISVLPIDYALEIKRNNLKLYDFLSYEFVCFDSKKSSCTELREKLITLFQCGTPAIRPSLRKPVRDCERLLLECFYSGAGISDITRNINDITTHSLYAKKKKALTKLGIPNNATMVRMLRNWHVFFDLNDAGSVATVGNGQQVIDGLTFDGGIQVMGAATVNNYFA
ncbi:hypothetical protein ACDY93_04145 [Enterobacter ludwigii]